MKMIEKIARAICEADGINPEWAGSVDPDCTYYAWENYIPHAKAALYALKEPTEGMKMVIRNENCVYGNESDFMSALVDAIEGEGK